MLNIANLTKTYRIKGQNLKVLDNLSLNVRKGEFVVVFGPNGSGKTTLLNLVAGLEKSDAGEIVKPKGIRINYIFQNFRESLFPWLKVIDNITLPLVLHKISKTEAFAKVKIILTDLKINMDLEAYPYQLSTGQQQLVAILRGIVSQANLFLMDEPFSSLDYNTNLLMEQKLMELWEKYKFTVLFVTHAAGEAVLLADRVLIMGQKPSHIVANIAIDLPRPRSYQLITAPEFNQLKARIINTCFAYLT